jgi:hypothetical protein
MTLTITEIEENKERLRQEIMERECLLAALEVLHKHATARRGAKSIDLGGIFPTLLPGMATTLPAGQVALLESAPAALPPPPPPKSYIHPDLEKFGVNRHGSNTVAVQWAIERLTGDYTLQGIQALLAREGRRLRSAEISVVLSRLKKRGKITEIQCGYGRKPSIFRKSPGNSGNETPADA